MIRGIYTSGAGMGVEQARIDICTNNLVNATTRGYKKDQLVQIPFSDFFLVQREQSVIDDLPDKWEYVGHSFQGAAVSRVETSFLPGQFQETGDSHHLALKKQNCFFVIHSPLPEDPGRELYTRDGTFSVDREGYLVTSRGEKVLGENGSVFVGEEKYIVDQEGVLFSRDKKKIARLRLVELSDLKALSKTGNNCYYCSPGAAVPATNPGLLSGWLEQANTNLTGEIITMLTATRAYEANARIFQAHNDLLGLAVQQVGSLGR